MCGEPSRWTSSALSREYLWLVADCMASTASRQRFMASPGGALDGDITCELMRSNSLWNYDEKWQGGRRKKTWNICCTSLTSRVEIIFRVSSHNLASSFVVSNLPATLHEAYYLSASKWEHRGRLHCPAELRRRRVYRESSVQLRCPHPHRPTRSNTPMRCLRLLIEI